MSLQVAVRRADVAPVPVVHVTVQGAGGGQRGEHPALDGEEPAARDQLQHLRLQHVHAGVDERRALPLPGLLQEAGHRAVLAQVDQAVPARVVDRREEDGAHAALGGVRGRQGGEVDVAEHVAVEDEEAAVAEHGLAVGDGPGGAERLVLDRVGHLEAVVRPVADDGLDGLGEKAGGEDGALHTVTREVVEDVRDEGSLHDRRHRLGATRGDRPQASPLAAHEDDCLARLLSTGAHRADQLATGAGTSSPRPMPSYSNPASAAATGSMKLRPSTSSGRAMAARGGPQVEARELLPLGDDDDRVGAGQRLEGLLADLDAGEQRVLAGVEHGVVGPDAGALVDEAAGQHDGGRLAQVVGVRLEREAEQRHGGAAQVAEPLLELADHAPLLQRVDLDDGVEQLEVVARVAGQLLERLDVLGEARPAVADAGLQEVRPDAVVEAHALGDGAHVGAHLLAHVGDLVDERDLGGEERVARVLDHLGRGHGGAHDVGVDAAVEVLDRRAVLLAEAADDDAVGLEEVLDGGALAQELGVGRVGDAGDAHRLQVTHDLLAGADGHRALHDQQALPAPGGDLTHGVLHAREVGVAGG